MNIFNSLGSNYDGSNVWHALTTASEPHRSQKLIRYLENRYQGQVVLTAKGREAIYLGLKTLNLPKNTEVALTGFTCFAVYQAISQAGYTSVYLDIDPTSLNFTPQTLLHALKTHPQLKVVIIQNTLGNPCDIIEIKKICQKHQLILIEDLAHSIGTQYTNQIEAGTFGELVTLSFSQNKIIDAVSGGALIIKNKIYQRVNMLTRWHNNSSFLSRLYPFFTYLIRITYPHKLGVILHAFSKISHLLIPTVDTLPVNPGSIFHWQSHLALLAYNQLPINLSHRRLIAQIYAANLPESLLIPDIVKNISLSTNLRFPILVLDRSQLINHLKKSGVYISDTWYDTPIAPKKYLHLSNYNNECPHAEKVSQQIINLPTHKNINKIEAQQICNLINLFYKT